MRGTQTRISLRVLFVTLLAVYGKASIEAVEVEPIRDLANPSPLVNVSNELLKISKWYCSKLLDEYDWTSTESIINNIVATDGYTRTLPKVVGTLQMCASFMIREIKSFRGLPKAEPVKVTIEQPGLLYRIGSGIASTITYPFTKVCEIPAYISDQMELIKRQWKGKTQQTKEEIMEIVTLLVLVAERACFNTPFYLNERNISKFEIDIINAVVNEVKDYGFLEELARVREGLTRCYEDVSQFFFETAERRKQRIDQESEVDSKNRKNKR